MMKDAGHFNQVKRLRVSDKDLVSFSAAYDVRNLVEPFKCPNNCSLVFGFRLHFPNSKSPIDPTGRCPDIVDNHLPPLLWLELRTLCGELDSRNEDPRIKWCSSNKGSPVSIQF